MNRAHEDECQIIVLWYEFGNEPCPWGSDPERSLRTCKMEMCISKGTPFSIAPHDSAILMMESECWLFSTLVAIMHSALANKADLWCSPQASLYHLSHEFYIKMCCVESGAIVWFAQKFQFHVVPRSCKR